MKKMIPALTALAVTLVSFTACSNPSSSESGKAPESSAPVKKTSPVASNNATPDKKSASAAPASNTPESNSASTTAGAKQITGVVIDDPVTGIVVTPLEYITGLTPLHPVAVERDEQMILVKIKADLSKNKYSNLMVLDDSFSVFTEGDTYGSTSRTILEPVAAYMKTNGYTPLLKVKGTEVAEGWVAFYVKKGSKLTVSYERLGFSELGGGAQQPELIKKFDLV